QSFTITEPGAPTVTYSEPIDSACQNTTAPFTLTGETPAGGTFSGPGVSGGLFVPATANLGYNMITYVYMDSVGCSGSAMDSIWVEICMGITETTVSTISVYPNPTSGIFTVNAETNSMITVYDAVGNLVVNVKATSAKTEINLTDFADGIYMIIVQTDNSISSEKIILNK
ncbi:MAG TPA: T9SS type A sorting domain-containing protein, partial [Bacteroidia bacterium]|nr:T9SS type A sorting domain-containing protein [Bacteroidia bacterium]